MMDTLGKFTTNNLMGALSMKMVVERTLLKTMP